MEKQKQKHNRVLKRPKRASLQSVSAASSCGGLRCKGTNDHQVAAENKSVAGRVLNSNPESGAREVQSHAHTQGRSELGQRGSGYGNLVVTAHTIVKLILCQAGGKPYLL